MNRSRVKRRYLAACRYDLLDGKAPGTHSIYRRITPTRIKLYYQLAGWDYGHAIPGEDYSRRPWSP